MAKEPQFIRALNETLEDEVNLTERLGTNLRTAADVYRKSEAATAAQGVKADNSLQLDATASIETRTLTTILGNDGDGNTGKQAVSDFTKTADAASTAEGKGASLIGYKQSGVGASDRVVLDKMRELPSVTDYGAVSDATDVTANFQAAADAHSVVRVPAGIWKILSNVTGNTRWVIDKGATFPSLPTVGNNGLQDMSRLGGRVMYFWDHATRGGVIFGDPDPWPDELRNPSMSLAEVSGVSPTGCVGILGASRSSDNPAQNQGTIGGEFQVWNDNLSAVEPCFGVYSEIRQEDGAGTIIGMEIDPVVMGTADMLSPFTARSINSKDAIGLVLASGGEVSGAQKASAAMAVWANGATWDRGIVFLNGALDTGSNMEAVAMQLGMRLAWYTSNGLQSWIKGDSARLTAISDTAATGYQIDAYRKRANYTDATGALDEVFRVSGYGYTGSADYQGGYFQILQRTAFSGGGARFSFDISAKNTAGSDVQVTLNGISDNSFAPFPDNTLSLGTASARWANSYAVNFRPGAGTAIWSSGAGTPEGAVTASVGSLYTRTDGGAGTTLYVKESGSGNTGWVAK